MYAVIASGRTKICNTRQELDLFKAIYSYVKYHYVETYAEGVEWIRQNQRDAYDVRVTNFGSSTNTGGFITIEYFITGTVILYNLDTSKFGRTYIIPDDDLVKVDNRPNLIKVKVCNTILDDMIIAHHVIAINRILRIIGEYADVNIVVPDISVYVAMTSYQGKDSTITCIREMLSRRIGGISFTVREYGS